MRADRLLSVLAAPALAGLTLAAAPSSASAQAVGDSVSVGTSGPPTMGTASYDGGGRRDPFVPLTVQLAPEEGPRFDSLRLTGVFVGSPGSSLVVLEDPARRGYFLRAGQSIGNARLVEIRPQSAVFEITEYGTTRRKILELERTGEQP